MNPSYLRMVAVSEGANQLADLQRKKDGGKKSPFLIMFYRPDSNTL